MKQNRINIGRRGLLKISSLAVAAFAIASRAGTSLAQAKAQDKKAALPQLDEKDPTAQALGYKHDAVKVDKKKFAQYQAGQTCSNCNLFQGKPSDAWAPCQIFAGKQVNGKGWCSAYVKKA